MMLSTLPLVSRRSRVASAVTKETSPDSADVNSNPCSRGATATLSSLAAAAATLQGKLRAALRRRQGRQTEPSSVNFQRGFRS
jgi:hypothetical protein